MDQNQIVALLKAEISRAIEHANKAIEYEDNDKFGKAIVAYTIAIRILYNASCFLNGVLFDTTNLKVIGGDRSVNIDFFRARIYEIIWNKIIQLYTRIKKLHDITQSGGAEIRALMRSVDIPLNLNTPFDGGTSSTSNFESIKDVLVKITLRDNDSFDFIIGHEKTKAKLYEIASMFSLNSNDYTKSILRNRYVSSNLMIILYGEPGTGKTCLVKALAAHLNIPLYELKVSELFNKYVGETEKTMTNIFNWALSSSDPKMIFIDELDSIFGKRGGNNEESLDKKIKTVFMIEMNRFIDNMETNNIIIGATNFIDDIDEAIRRRSVLNIEICRPANLEEYLQLILHEFNKFKLNYEESIPENIAKVAFNAQLTQSKLVDITKKLFSLCTSKIRDEINVMPLQNNIFTNIKMFYSLNGTTLRDREQRKYIIVDGKNEFAKQPDVIRVNLKTHEGNEMANNIILPPITEAMWHENRSVYLQSAAPSR